MGEEGGGGRGGWKGVPHEAGSEGGGGGGSSRKRRTRGIVFMKLSIELLAVLFCRNRDGYLCIILSFLPTSHLSRKTFPGYIYPKKQSAPQLQLDTCMVSPREAVIHHLSGDFLGWLRPLDA